MRANHHRGIVTNHIVAQNLRGRRPEETSLIRKSWQDADQPGNRCKGGVTLVRARIRNRGNLRRKREESYKPQAGKAITPVLREWRINS